MLCSNDKLYRTPEKAMIGAYIQSRRLVVKHASQHLRGRCAWCEEDWDQEQSEDEGYSEV
jgi:hypothetical protein